MKKTRKNTHPVDIEKDIQSNWHILKTKKVIKRSNRYPTVYIPPRPYIEIIDYDVGESFS